MFSIMLFRDVKQGYPVYVLDKSSLVASTGKAVHVSNPHFQNTNPSTPFNPSAQMYVDITVETDGKTQTYTIPESLAVTYAGMTVLSTDRDGIIREVEALKSQNEEVLHNIEKNKSTIESCNKILTEWNPTFAERKKQDARIDGLEKEVHELGDAIRNFLNKMSNEKEL